MADFTSQLDVNAMRRLRGMVLEMIHLRHREQGSHMDHVMLWGLLNKMAFSVGQRDVITVLQDLKDRGYITCRENKNNWTGRIQIERIGITPKGRDLVEHTSEDDPAVLVT